MKKIIKTENAPLIDLPFNQAIVKNNIVFLSGQVGYDPGPDNILPPTFEGQLRNILQNIINIVEAAGGTKDDIVKVTAFLQDINDFPEFNKIYREYFTENHPARSAFQAGTLCNDFGKSTFLVEVEAIAVLDE